MPDLPAILDRIRHEPVPLAPTRPAGLTAGMDQERDDYAELGPPVRFLPPRQVLVAGWANRERTSDPVESARWPSYNLAFRARTGNGMADSPDRLHEQLAAAEKTLLALQALVVQSKEMIIATRKIIEETKAAQAKSQDGVGQSDNN